MDANVGFTNAVSCSRLIEIKTLNLLASAARICFVLLVLWKLMAFFIELWLNPPD